MSHFLVTGGCGFAGSHIVKHLLDQGHQVTVLDKLTYAGPLVSLAPLACKQLRFVHHDFAEPLPSLGIVDYVIHNGAESHVGRSLLDPGLFVRSNVIGTLNLLEATFMAKKFVYVSTDEVFGPAGQVPHTDDDQLRPTNPYAASKAAGEFLCHSYFRSFGRAIVITRTANMFGERQHPEKFIPKVVKRLLSGETVDVHCHNGQSGRRSWVYVGEQARALTHLAEHGIPGCTYHVSAGTKVSNMEMLQKIAGILNLTYNFKYRCVEVNNDFDYSLKESPSSVAWKMPGASFDQLLTQTVRWYRDNPSWLAE